MIILIDLKHCSTVLEFLDIVVKALKIMPFYGTNLDVIGKTLASLDKQEFTFPLTLKLENVQGYAEKCPTGWRIFLKSLEKAKEEYSLKKLKFSWDIRGGEG